MSTTTEPQHMTALARANEVRLAAARHKRDIGAHRRQANAWAAAANAIESPPDYLRNMRLRPFLKSCKGLGDHKIDAMFRLCGIGDTFTVGTLTPRQRKALVELLRAGTMGKARARQMRDSELSHSDDIAREGF